MLHSCSTIRYDRIVTPPSVREGRRVRPQLRSRKSRVEGSTGCTLGFVIPSITRSKVPTSEEKVKVAQKVRVLVVTLVEEPGQSVVDTVVVVTGQDADQSPWFGRGRWLKCYHG